MITGEEVRVRARAGKLLKSMMGEERYRSLTSPTRATTSDVVGRLADPDSVPDPFSVAVPDGCFEVKARDVIVPVYDPQFVATSGVDWADDDLVIGVHLGGDARAYPVGALNKREMVLDKVGGVPIVATWCPRCGSGVVHKREVDGVEIVLGNQGALCHEAMTWWDHDTGSVWSQPTGQAIAGPRKGQSLELVASTLTSWRSWRAQHPDTVALRERTRPSHYSLDELSVVVSILGETVAFPLAKVRRNHVVNDAVGGTPLAVVSSVADPDRWAVVSRVVGNDVVSLESRNGGVVDITTGSTLMWNRDGGLVAENLGWRLRPIPASTVHPKEFNGIWPEGRTWG